MNRDLYLENIEKGQKTLSCILEEFSSIKLPLGVAVTEILRPIAVRYYSISSSSVENPDIVSVTAVIVRYAIQQEKLLNRSMKKAVIKQGLATSWLEKLHDEYSLDTTKELYCSTQVRYSTFRLPKNHQIPIIMVGPGTGVAPFRGFIRERVHLATQGEAIGPTWLFYGCRNQESVYQF